MNDKLSQLEWCHFIWKPLDGIANCPWKSKINLDPQSRIDFLNTDIEMNPEIEGSALTLMAYLYTQLESPKLAEALLAIDRVIKKSQTFQASAPDRAKGYMVVCLSLKAHILHLAGHSEQEVDSIISELQQLYPITDKAQAFIHGIHAYACSTLGPAKYKQGLKLSLLASKLDPTWFAWPMSAASLAGRIRRFVEGSKSYPTAMEEENMKRAVVLSKEMQPLPLVFLADLYYVKGRFDGLTISECTPLLDEAEKLYRMAYKLAPNSIYVLTRCGKAFATMQYDCLAEECYQKSLKLQPNDGVSLRGLGKLYEFSENKKNLNLALDCYKKAATQWESHNVHCDLDVCRIRRKLDPNFDEFGQYRTLEQKYSDDKRSLVYIHNAAARQEDYLRNKQPPKYNNRYGNRNNYRNDSQCNFRRDETYNDHRARNNGSSYDRQNQSFRGPPTLHSAYPPNMKPFSPEQKTRFGPTEPSRVHGHPRGSPAPSRKFPSSNNHQQNRNFNERRDC